MTTTAENYLCVLERVCSTAIEPHSGTVDHQGTFPNHAIEALKSAALLGAVSAPEVGGLGLGHRGAAASSEPLSTLAFSESTSRSQFWAPTSAAERNNGSVILNAQMSWITSANHASSYVWSSRPVETEGMSTLWLVPADAHGLSVESPFNGLGLRGNDSSPVLAANVSVEPAAKLGEDGAGFDAMLQIVLPMFCVCNPPAQLDSCRPRWPARQITPPERATSIPGRRWRTPQPPAPTSPE